MKNLARKTEARVRALPRQRQESDYRTFYAAYLAAIENGDEQLERQYRQLLRYLQELWDLTPGDIVVLEGKEANTQANSKEMINLLLGGLDKPSPLQ